MTSKILFAFAALISEDESVKYRLYPIIVPRELSIDLNRQH